MNWLEFDELVHGGLSRMALHGRTVVFNLARDIFDELDFDDDRIFLNPLLFSSELVSNPDTLRLALMGAVKKIDSLSIDTISTKADSDGFLLIPFQGYIKTKEPFADVRLAKIMNSDYQLINSSGAEVLARIELMPDASPHEFFVIDRPSVLFEGSMEDIHGERIDFGHIKALADLPKSEMLRALDLLQEKNGRYYDLIRSTTVAFLLFRNEAINSFATERLPGIAFLSLPKEYCSSMLFLEEITHQCGHIMFSDMTFSENILFDGDEHMPIADVTGEQGDNRTVYVVCHALFTEMSIASVLHSCIRSGILSDRELLEARGRLAFVLKKYCADRKNVCAIGSLSTGGRLVMDWIIAEADQVLRNSKPFVSDLNLRGQTYNFDFGEFLDSNA
jgi:hypothetical protein